MNVLGVRESQWQKDDGTTTTTYWVTLEGREKDVPCYDAAAAKLEQGHDLELGFTQYGHETLTCVRCGTRFIEDVA